MCLDVIAWIQAMTSIGVVGAGRIGGNAGRLLARAGHDVTVSFSRDPERLQALAADIGARAGTPAEAARSDVVILSVPWPMVDAALAETGPLDGRIVIDTTNQFGAGGWEELPDGLTAAQLNQRRMPGARLVKSFNTLTAAFQASEAGRPDPRVVLFLCGDDAEAKDVVAGLIRDAGFEPADVGALSDAAVMEAPRRPGAVYGEEYRPADAQAVVEAVRAGRPIPPTPSYA
jgi:8-hydroxy-5-deazaflavin:NADPH oxidoreductase